MKRFFDTLLLHFKSRQLLRLTYVAMLAIIGIICTHLSTTLPKFGKNNNRMAQYLTLKRTVEQLELACRDSAWSDSIIKTGRGIMQGWNGAAQLMESIRTRALSHGIEYSYQIDSLITLPQSVNHFFLVPIRIKAFPINGQFETAMQFLQEIATDSSVVISVQSIEFIGGELGLASMSLQLSGWMRL